MQWPDELIHMALSHSRDSRSLLSRLRPALERLKCSFVEDRNRAHFSSHTAEGEFSKWKKLDSRNFGIARSMISTASWTVLKKLREKGLEAYLVGGCVRDLLLNKVPKDFDVITTGELQQVKRRFRKAVIVGKRFPICMVTLNGSVVEVSSFETVAKVSEGKTKYISQMPKGCDPSDLRRWKNCLSRDFTVNSLFFDPFVNAIYDYTNAIVDLKSLKLRTVKPAHVSFKEDQARILRGLRLAARLNLSFSEETEDAVYNLSSSVAELSMSRILMEVNYMLSYGAAERSLLLLKRFQLLDMLLPFHAAYLSEQVDNRLGVRSLMLMKLFFNLDQLITCDRPCTDSLWVAILAFHLAIFSYPQHPAVVLTFASLLYHRTLEESITFARQNVLATRIYIPEISDAPNDLLDDEIVERVALFVGHVKKSVGVLINSNCLLKSMARFPEFPFSGLVFIPQKMGQKVERIFDILSNGVSFVRDNKRSKEIHHRLLKEGNVNEIRFVLGTIITRTMVHAQGAVAESGKNDLQATNPIQKKLDVSEQTRNTSAHLAKLFLVNKNEKRRNSTSPNFEELANKSTKKTRLSDNATKKTRLSEINTAIATTVNENEKRRSSTSSNFEELANSSTKKTRLSDNAIEKTRLSEITTATATTVNESEEKRSSTSSN